MRGARARFGDRSVPRSRQGRARPGAQQRRGLRARPGQVPPLRRRRGARRRRRGRAAPPPGVPGRALARAKIAARSQARNLVALRQLFRHLRAERHIARDPTADLELPRIGRPLPVMLTLRRGRGAYCHSHAPTARAACATPPCSRRSTPPACASPSSCGLRQIDVNLPERFLSTVGKGRKQRLVPLGERAHDRIVEYLATRAPVAARGAAVAGAVRHAPRAAR